MKKICCCQKSKSKVASIGCGDDDPDPLEQRRSAENFAENIPRNNKKSSERKNKIRLEWIGISKDVEKLGNREMQLKEKIDSNEEKLLEIDLQANKLKRRNMKLKEEMLAIAKTKKLLAAKAKVCQSELDLDAANSETENTEEVGNQD